MGNACAGSPRTTPPQALQASRRGEDADKLRRIRSSAIFSESLSPLGAAYRRLAFAKLGHVRLTELARAIVENEDLFARVAGLVIAHPLVFTFREVDNSVRNNGRFDVGGVLFHLATQGGYSNATQPTVSRPFCARFAPVLRRFSAVLLCWPASWRRDGENGRKMAENGRILGEKRARNSGG